MIPSPAYRLHPGTLYQAQLLSGISGIHHYVWNEAIGQDQDATKQSMQGKRGSSLKRQEMAEDNREGPANFRT